MSRMSRAQGGLNLALVVGATIVIAILVNVLVMGTRARIDLTENQVNVLSEASRTAVAALDGLEVRVYVSPDLPESVPMGYTDVKTQGLAQKLVDKLEEYKAYGSSMTITLVTDDVVGEAERNGVKPFTGKGANLSKTGQLEFDKYVLGASFHYENATEVFDLALDPKYFEFEITKRLLRLKDKADSAVLMKDLLAAGEALGDVSKTCAKALEDAVPAEGKKDNDLAAVLTGEASQSKITALKSALPSVKAACTPVAAAAQKAEPFKDKNDPLGRMVLIANALGERLTQLDGTLSAQDPQQQAQALGQHQELVAIAKAIDGERKDMEDSPGRRRIGFVCNGKTFCPFPSSKPLVPKELEGALTQKNPILGQMLPAVQRIQEEMNMVLQQINQGLFKARGFDIVRVDLDETLPDDMQALVVFGAKGTFSDWQLSQIDQFVLNGGSLVVFLDSWDASIQLYTPKGEIDQPSLTKNTSNIADLLKTYGIVPNGGMVLEPKSHDAIALMQFLRQGNQLIPFQSREVPYPMMPTFTKFDSSDPLVRATTSLTLPFTTWFTLEPRPGVEETALVTSSEDAASTDSTATPLDPQTQVQAVQDGLFLDARGVAPGAQPTSVPLQRGPFVVAALARGEFQSHFKGKEAPKKPEKKDDPDDPTKDAKKGDVPGKDKPRRDSGKGRVLALGSNLGLEPLSAETVFEGFDMAMLAGENMDYIEKFQQYRANYQNWSTRINQVQHTLADNLGFLQNVLDWSVQREALAELRSKQYTARPLPSLQDGDRTLWKMLGLLIPSVLFLGYGLLRWKMRNSRRKALAL